jgi:hypothetical protein
LQTNLAGGSTGANGEVELGSGRGHAQKIIKDAREEPDGSAVVGVERVVGEQLAEDAASREPRANGENEAEAGAAPDEARLQERSSERGEGGQNALACRCVLERQGQGGAAARGSISRRRESGGGSRE